MKAVLAVVLAAPVFLPGHTAEATPPPHATGFVCGSTSLQDPTGSDGTRRGEIEGGPIVVSGLVSVTLICTIQVGLDTTHEGTDVASVSATGVGVAVLPPTPVSYRAGPEEIVSLCTELVIVDARGDAWHLYWDSVRPDGSSRFSTSPATACELGCQQSIPSNCYPPLYDDLTGPGRSARPRGRVAAARAAGRPSR